ncbi:DUF4260 domain-containing protein [Ohtaekwangia koreensis]|uniref:DUF4260 domain-containing protein n=1 Tax=Ohtaekwangia koreensis TaxID=688867 RepID=A0A1T5JNU0_9BACT|nr:DUF4260 domain-containing protein [Ohtaekwangia koreensis]SKC53167.1 protein of unknown function [Ohtaekwangia koreensis]
MKKLTQLEEFVMFITTLLLFYWLGLSWWWFIGCILLPDLGMIGYLHNARTGAWMYNFFHHRAIAIVIGLIGYFLGNTVLEFAGLILFSHSAMDRMLGYGLKYESGFKFTHLGEIGQK